MLWRALFTQDGARVITISENHQGVAWGVSPTSGTAWRWRDRREAASSREEWTLSLPDRPYDPACADGS